MKGSNGFEIEGKSVITSDVCMYARHIIIKGYMIETLAKVSRLLYRDCLQVGVNRK